MTSAQSLCLVLGCDDGFVIPLAVTLSSALRHLDPAQAVVIYIIDGGISAAHKRRLENVTARARPGLDVCWVAPTAESMAGLEGARHLTPATYLRLFIPDLLSEEITHALYLDCDLLISSDIGELWGTELEGAVVAAARDYAIAEMDHPFSGVKNYRELGMEAKDPYFNAGVLLMDVGQWRKQETAMKALRYALKHGERLGNCDQDALNASLPGKWLPLDHRWNVQTSLFYLHDIPAHGFVEELLSLRPTLLREAKIVHFTGTPKPWNHWCGHPATEEWVKALLSSGWFTLQESIIWAIKYGIRRSLFKIKVTLHHTKLRERTD